MNSRKLVLIDGTAVLYRAFYAIRELSTSAGKPTNAVFGFIRMLKIIKDSWAPTHLAVTFDGGVPKERKALLADYKAQRPSMPDALRDQISLVEDYLDRAGIAWFRIKGEEADDIIASLADKARRDCDAVLIATSDKDIFQLVDDKIKIIPVAGKEGLLDSAGVKAKTGVMPSQIIDWLSLVGDSSDNIPGVPGVGPKTAARLLEQFGSLDEMFAGLDKVANDRIRKVLEQSRELIERNRAMVRLRKDLECSFLWENFEVREPQAGKLLPFLEEMEFHAMAKELREQELFLL